MTSMRFEFCHIPIEEFNMICGDVIYAKQDQNVTD